jgi:hypothetical protein
VKTGPGTPLGFDTNLDTANIDQMTAEEAKELLEWYEAAHGDGERGLTEFVPFFIENRPGALKRYRIYVRALHDYGGLPQIAIALLFLRYYMAIGNERGIRYQIVAARQWGATKGEVLEMIEAAFVDSGPYGGNAAATAQAYLKAWPAEEERRIPDPWPDSWYRSSYSLPAETAAERFFETYAPEVLGAFAARIRYVRNPSELPQMLLPLSDLLGAVARSRPADAARVAKRALGMGATRSEAIEVVGLGSLYLTSSQFDDIVQAVGPVIANATSP